MTREHLLQAMGLLDDDLIREAEEPVRNAGGKRHLEAWISLAACLAIVLTIGYGMMMGTPGGSNSTSGASQEASAGDSENASSSAPTSSGTAAAEPGEGQNGDGSPNMSDEMLLVIVRMDGMVYSYCHRYEEDRVLDALPEGCRSLGEVGVYREGENCVYTDMGEFPGCPLWIAGEGWDGPLYLETPESTYLECVKS